MPWVRFLNDGLEIEVPSGTTLSLAAREAEATLPFGCRAGTCGACALSVVDGEQGLDAPGFVEEDTLLEVGQAGPGRRLGCQIIVREADVSVRW